MKRHGQFDGATVRGSGPKPAPQMSLAIDTQFRQTIVRDVRDEDGGWQITGEDGWSFFVPSTSPITPLVGSSARFYGQGIGYRVRGLTLDGVTVFYRTAAEDERQFLVDLYGSDAADWLARWDAGRTVWSVEMGGLGPSYEQCLQLAAVEVVRYLARVEPVAGTWSEAGAFQRITEEIDRDVLSSPCVATLQLSGAQWCAAKNLASRLYRFGPIEVFTQPEIKDRLIQITRWFPVAAGAQTNPGSR